jgi:hypothetical protein
MIGAFVWSPSLRPLQYALGIALVLTASWMLYTMTAPISVDSRLWSTMEITTL